MAYSEEVQNLAETLKSSGLAASMADALEMAQKMIGKKEEPKPAEKPEDGPSEYGPSEYGPSEKADAEQTTLNGLGNAESNAVLGPADEDLNQEEVFKDKPDDNNESDEKQSKIDYSKEKKVDLNSIFSVNK